MRRIRNFVAIAFLALAATSAWADEGMWMIQDINEALEKKMRERGLKLSASEIYNADAPGAGVADAVVSIGFYCTGSLISQSGLIITNHHCAYSNIAKLSTPEHNYLEDGFWAMNRNEEIPCEGESVFFLKKVIDVTTEVKNLKKELSAKGQPIGSRKIASLMEKKYQGNDGLEPIFSSMYSGEKCYISLYKVYTDLRLVAAPPVCIGYFGGDTDNWMWPRQNCDFTIYRIYENGKPVTSEKSLKISMKGYEPGSFSMVIGYPGSTDRYCSPYELSFQEEVNLPISNAIRRPQMEIIRKWMDADDDVRMKYSDWFFSLSNVHLNNEGMQKCYSRFSVRNEKEAIQDRLGAWIDSNEDYRSIWGGLLSDLEEAYSSTREVERDKTIYRESLFRGTFINRFILRAGNSKDLEKAKGHLLEGIASTDPRVEKELLEHALSEFYTKLDSYYYGKFQQRMFDRFGTDFEAMAEYLWSNSVVASAEIVNTVESMERIQNDPLRLMFTDTSPASFNNRNDHLAKSNRKHELEREYKRALYWMRLTSGEEQYPDANSTMRITYGVVGGYQPNDGVVCNWYSTPDGILQKYNPDVHDFNLNNRQKSLLEGGKWGKWGFDLEGRKRSMIVDFLTDNDITGGNSGSPVLNDKGELIGLAFDGNIESLASDASFTPCYNKCINTDIRFVLWVLDKYAGMKKLIRELDIS